MDNITVGFKKLGFFKKILLFASAGAAAAAMLAVTLSASGLLFALLFTALMGIAALGTGIEFLSPDTRIKSYPKAFALSLVWAAFALYSFYRLWHTPWWYYQSRIPALAELLHVPGWFLEYLLPAAAAIASIPFVFWVLCVLSGYKSPIAAASRKADNSSVSSCRRERRSVLLCAVSAFAVISLCSKSSFLYPLNDWGDANCFFTVGKAMMNGMVPYRDLIEQKGPVLYFVYGLAWLISHNTFLGVYFIELVACFFFLYFSHKSVRLFTAFSKSCLIVPATALMAYTTFAFSHGGSVEELCLPIFAYTVYVGLRAFTGGPAVSRRQAFLIGILSGLVFWAKFTLVGFFIGWFILPAAQCIKNRNIKELFKLIFLIAAGVLASTLPIVIYFARNGAIGDWLTVYLYNNIFLYPASESGSGGMLDGVAALIKGAAYLSFNGLFGIALYCLGFWAVKKIYKENKAAQLLVMMFTAGFFFVYIGGVCYSYYAFVFSVFLPFGIMALTELLPVPEDRCAALKRPAVKAACLALCLTLSPFLTPNSYLLGTDRQEMPQYKFRQIILQEDEPSLLNYGFLDGGFYTVCEIMPECRAFCRINMPLAKTEQIQQQYLESSLCDFVVTEGEELTCSYYECVSESTVYYEGYDTTYYLYRRMD